MPKKIFLLPIILLLVQIIFPQTVEKDRKEEISDELKKEATAFLRETAAEVNGLRTLENRISLSSEMANLMWFSDEKEARAMFQIVISDFRQLLTNYDAQMNAVGATPVEDTANYSFLSGSANQPERKFAQAIGVRQQIAKAIAEHDPQLAFDFFSGTGAAITNETFRKRLQASDGYFEARLVSQIAEKDAAAALKYGRQTLAKGFNYELIGLLKKIYAKDAEKGAAFGEDIAAKLKFDASKPDGFYYLNNILDLGLKNLEAIKGKSDKRPMFSEQTLRDLAELSAQELLKREDAENYEISSPLAAIEKILPARAAQIRQKFEIKQKTKPAANANVGTAPPPPPAPPMPSGAQNALAKQQQLSENIKNLDSQKLSDEDRRKVVAQSKKIIAETGNRQEKILALTVLAVQIFNSGDQELASELMNDVRGLINIQPKNYRDFMEIWLLAGGYAQVDAPKAFPLLEDSILRLNETISAVIKVGEFVDVSGEIIDDGEVQVGGFGGEITNGLLRELGATDSTIRRLAVADFTRTKNLTEKFDRPEVRILAKMLVLRGIFADVKKTKQEEPD